VKFFADKVAAVRADTEAAPTPEIKNTATDHLSSWTPVTASEVEKMIGLAANKTCSLDPAPTWLIKQFRHLLAPFITLFVNSSLNSGYVPQKHKQAIVFPKLKKDNLDVTQLKNYRPISNLSFLSKLLESAVQKRLQSFLDQTGGLPKQQSAYRRWHSTETALLRIYNDLLQAADRGEVSALCMLDLSAAFDSVDHELLLRRLEFRFGFTGDVLEWIKSYLTNRTFTVIHRAHKSSEVELECSVPQGSVLGPLLFILYTAELADIAVKWNVNLHSYADDTQVLLHCKPDAVSCGVVLLEQCIDEIEQWMAANRLKLNADKTELLWTGTCSQLKKLTPMHPSLAVGSCTVKPADSARLLGVLISPDLTLKQHISRVCVSCFYQLRQIRSVRRSLDDESTATLVHAFVASRIDYCCSLLFGSPKTVTDKLQRVLNAAARVVTNTRKYDRGLHHTMRHDLHWLDMTDRIQFRIAVTVYRCLHGTAPEYLSELFVPASTRSSRHCLRSSDSNKLVVPPVKLSTYGRRSFTASGPIVWNSLPEYLRDPTLSVDTFRRYLKTYFFARY